MISLFFKINIFFVIQSWNCGSNSSFKWWKIERQNSAAKGLKRKRYNYIRSRRYEFYFLYYICVFCEVSFTSRCEPWQQLTSQRECKWEKISSVLGDWLSFSIFSRLYLTNSPVVRAENMRFKDEGVRDVVKDVFLPWYNAYRFLVQNILKLQKVCIIVRQLWL